MTRLAALLHDIGKPATRRFEAGGKVSFHHHDVVGAKLARKRLTALRFSADVIAAVSKLIELHLRFHGYADGRVDRRRGPALRPRRRGAARTAAHPDPGRLHHPEHRRRRPGCGRAYDELEHRIDELAAEEELNAMRPDLDGRQIMEILQIPAGPAVGEAYRFLLERRDRGGPARPRPRPATNSLEWWAASRDVARPPALGLADEVSSEVTVQGRRPLLSDSVPASRLMPRLTTAKSTPSRR